MVPSTNCRSAANHFWEDTTKSSCVANTCLQIYIQLNSRSWNYSEQVHPCRALNAPPRLIWEVPNLGLAACYRVAVASEMQTCHPKPAP